MNKVLILFISILTCMAQAEWQFDFSRRTGKQRVEELKSESRAPASIEDGRSESSPGQVLASLFSGSEPAQEIVILNTEKGFIPSQVRVRTGLKYRVHVVNVNEKEKNVSFILDAFSESHSTFYGKIKSFELEAKKEGVFSFQSPETGSEGRLVVFGPSQGPSMRQPAGESQP